MRISDWSSDVCSSDLKKPGAIAAILRRRGFQRTVTAVVVKTKRLALDRTDVDHFTATALAGVMGVDAKTVTRWIEVAGLKAERRGTDRTAAQGGEDRKSTRLNSSH